LNQTFYILSAGKGPLSQGRYAATTLSSKYVDSTLDWPDIMLMMFPSSPGREMNSEVSEQRLGIRKDIWNLFYGPYAGLPQFTIWPIILRPKSRGWVKLKSTNPMDPPLINPNYFSNISDMSVLLEGMKEAFRIANSRPLQNLYAKPFLTLVPGCELYAANDSLIEPKELNETLFSDSYLQCMARSLTMTAGDYVGTCRMGSDEDSNRVVNSKLKVIGVRNLRVIDASIIPEIPSSNINAAVVMIGERGSQFIKFDYRNKDLILKSYQKTLN
jgi:choline dehydrogenase